MTLRKRVRIPAFALGWIAVSMLHSGCSTPPGARSEPVQFGSSVFRRNELARERAPTRAELQDSILRFETEFTARTHDAFRPLMRSRSNLIRQHATRANLLYAATSLDIALGAIPEQNLLDMLTYIELIRDVFRDYWIPKVYGSPGKRILRAFDESADELRELAAPYLTDDQLRELRARVDAWHGRNPERIAVETIRLADFSAEAGIRAKELRRQISGILAPISAATAAANQAILLGERGIYFAQKLPFLLGMQSTVALQDALTEIDSSLSGLALSRTQLEQVQRILARAEAKLNAGSRRFLRSVLLMSLATILFAGVIYVLAKLAYDRLSRRNLTMADRPGKQKAA